MGAKEDIVIAADEIFGKVGFDAATTREIAEQSGVNKALIHYHFGSKEQLLESVLDRYFARLREEIEQALAVEGSLQDRFEHLIDVYADFLSRNLSFCKIVQREASGGANVHLIRKQMVPIFEIGKKLVLAAYPATADGELAAEQLLVSVYGMVITYFTYSDVIGPLIGNDPMSPESIAKRKLHLRRVVRELMSAVAGEGAQQ